MDSAAYADAVIPPYYDSMIAKLIVKGRDRAEAIGRMKRALEMFVIEGIKTSIPLHRRILADPDFAAGRSIRTSLKDCWEQTENRCRCALSCLRLYVILDAALLTIPERDCAQELAEAGVRLTPVPEQDCPGAKYLMHSRESSPQRSAAGMTFLVNDRPDVAVLAGASGVHVGQDDLGVGAGARAGGRRKIGWRFDSQSRAISSGSSDFSGLHRGGADLCDLVESESRSSRGRGFYPAGARAHR